MAAVLFRPAVAGRGRRGADALVVLGRLAPPATIASARAEMDAIAAQLREQYPASNAALRRAHRSADRSRHRPDDERSLWLLFGSVGFVLLIACANVANLVAGARRARRNEFALRTALGAGRARLVRQALAENLVLSIACCRRRPVVCLGRHRVLAALAAGALPRADTIQLDGGVLLFLLAASLGGGCWRGCCRRCSFR